MSGPRSTPPSNLNHLQSLISKIASEHGREVKRVQRAVANTIVGQMLPPGVVKGGTAMKLRVGHRAFDTASVIPDYQPVMHKLCADL